MCFYLRNKTSVPCVLTHIIKYGYKFGCIWIESRGRQLYNSYILIIRIKHCLFPSLCIGENHGTVLEFFFKITRLNKILMLIQSLASYHLGNSQSSNLNHVCNLCLHFCLYFCLHLCLHFCLYCDKQNKAWMSNH